MPREDIPGVDGRLQGDNAVLEVSQTRPAKKPRGKNKQEEKSITETALHRKNLHHYERYPPKGRQL